MSATIPKHTPPKCPPGTRWEYRGTGWQCQHEATYYTVTQDGRPWLSIPQKARGRSDLHYFEAVAIEAEPPLKNPSGPNASISGSNLGHPQDAIVIGYDMAAAPPEPHPVEGWHGPIKGPIRKSCDCSPDIASWLIRKSEWVFGGYSGRSPSRLYLVRKGSSIAVELGLESAPNPYPNHTPPEPPSPWHRWEYKGMGVGGLQPPWYRVLDEKVIGVELLHESKGWGSTHYFQAVPTCPLIHVNGIWFPEPQREPLEPWQVYFIAVPDLKKGCHEVRWYDNEHDNRFIAAGLIHLTCEAASAHARAMLSLTARKDGA